MNSKVLIIAEAGVNHNGSLELAKQLVETAAAAGADYVKFQTFKAEKVISSRAPKAEYQIQNTGLMEESQLDMVRKLELDREAHETLIQYAWEKGIKFLSTPFDLESIDLLDELVIGLFKIPSGEITNLPYLRKIGSKGKPIILSTGMANLGEVETALEVLIGAGAKLDDITVLHCNTEYPTPMKDVNLRAMLTLADAFKVKVGYSDHTLGIEVPVAAVAMGAVCIEKHFTLDRNMEGPDHRASLEPGELKAMVQAIRNIEIALGDGIKRPSASERKNIPIARKSIHIARSLPAHHILAEADLIMKRPGNGLSPMMLEWTVGKKTARPLPEDHLLTMSDLLA